jgi:hypothetical protein
MTENSLITQAYNTGLPNWKDISKLISQTTDIATIQKLKLIQEDKKLDYEEFVYDEFDNV